MKNRTFVTTLIAILLLAAVIAAGLHAVFTVAYVQASFSTLTQEGEVAAQQLKEALNAYLGRSTTFLDLEEVRATAESDPRFSVVSLEKRFPSSVALEIEERQAAFAVRTGTGYALVDNEGVRIGETSSAQDYIELTGDFSVSFSDGRAEGEYMPELLAVYASFLEALGEPRANLLSVSLGSSGASARFDSLRFQTREGVEIVIWNPSDRPSDTGLAAVQKYLDLTEVQRVRGSIVVQIVSASGEVNAEYFPEN